jgi:uncharacterized membrane protein YhaH (DUF805 family)
MNFTSSTTFFYNVASSTGALIQQSFPLFGMFIGIVLAIFAIMLIVKAAMLLAKRFR